MAERQRAMAERQRVKMKNLKMKKRKICKKILSFFNTLEMDFNVCRPAAGAKKIVF